MADQKPGSVGFPQKYNETPSSRQTDLNPAHVLDTSSLPTVKAPAKAPAKKAKK